MFRFHFATILILVLTNFGRVGSGKILELPHYQREFKEFSEDERDELIQTIMDDGYLPPALVRYEEGDEEPSKLVGRLRKDVRSKKGSVEDSQRRWTTLQRFRENKFAWGYRKAHTKDGVAYPEVPGRYFRDLTDAEKHTFDNFQIHIEAYCSATDEEAVRTFHNVNRGSSSLSVGEVMRSQIHNIPLAVIAAESLLNILNEYWGKSRSLISKCGKDLVIATATFAGIVYGSKYFTTKEKVLMEVICRPITPEMREKLADRVQKLREVWTSLPVKGQATTSNWNFTKFNAFILTGIEESGRPWEEQKACWVRFIAECKEDKEVYVTVLGASGLSGTHATPAWWRAGWEKVFARYA